LTRFKIFDIIFEKGVGEMNLVFFKCLGTGDYHIHIFSTAEEACEFLHVKISFAETWYLYMDKYGPSIYKDIIKGYSLVFLDEGTEEVFFDKFSDACNKLFNKLSRIVRPLILSEGGDALYARIIYGQEQREKAIAYVSWLSNNILAPRDLLLGRGFSVDELYWLQAYVGLRIPTSMKHLSKLK
jgi:hypothetical protein